MAASGGRRTFGLREESRGKPLRPDIFGTAKPDHAIHAG
jgi:hypothetical protein